MFTRGGLLLILSYIFAGAAGAEPVCSVRGVHGLWISWTINIEDSTSAAISAPKNQFYDCRKLAATLADWQKSGQCKVDWGQVTSEALAVLDIQANSTTAPYTKKGCTTEFNKMAQSAPSDTVKSSAAAPTSQQQAAASEARRD